MTKDEALKLALEALITASGQLNNEAFVKVMMARDAVVEALAQPEQEPFAWGVDWGKAGDIACVSIIKRLPNDVIEVVAVEYAPYSYTHPPQRTEQEPVKMVAYNCFCGRTMKFESVHGVVAPQRTWVGLEGEEIRNLWEEATKPDRSTMTMVTSFAKSIEAKLKEKNGA